ncbi:hypothetical protein ACEWY4_020076 [Coilia grayii]|uniref:E3 ubiquitin-protein ligase TRIM33-like n=1 Tax=Coilia grayii TaxID=363190 RepID=A0ABD1JEP8_9TELE
MSSIPEKSNNNDSGQVEQEVSSPSADQRNCASVENCCVCDTSLHPSRLPQLFPCLHSACNTCLSTQHVENNTKSIECPFCKKLFGITEITENVIYNQSHLSGKGDVFKCGGCEELAISGWCKDCGEFLCSDCVSAHNRVKLTRSHTIVPQELSTGSCPTLYCTTHREEPLKFFCVTCNQLTCRNCQLVDHRNHSYQMLSDAVSAIKERLQSLQETVTKQKTRVNQSLLDLDQRLQKLTEQTENLKKKLSLAVLKMYRAMLLKAAHLFQSVTVVYDREVKQLSYRKTALRIMEERQDYIISFIEKTLSIEGNAGVLLKNRIESQVKDLLFQSVLPASSMVEVKVQVNQSIMTSVQNFGRISIKMVPFAQNQAEPLLECDVLSEPPTDCSTNPETSTTSPDSSTAHAALLGLCPPASCSGPSRSHSALAGFLHSTPHTTSSAPQTLSASAPGFQPPSVSLPNQQQHSVVLPSPSSNTSCHQQQAHAAMVVLPSPVTHNASPSVEVVSVPQAQAHSRLANSPPRHRQPQLLLSSLNQTTPSLTYEPSLHSLLQTTPAPAAQCSTSQLSLLALVQQKQVDAQGLQAAQSASSKPWDPQNVSAQEKNSILSSILTSATAPSSINPLQAQCVSTDSTRTQSVPDQTQSSTSQPSLLELVQRIQMSSVDAQHLQTSTSASSKSLGPQHVRTLDQNSLLLSDSNAAILPSFTTHHQSQPVSTDSTRTQLVPDQTQSSTSQPSLLQLVQQIQMSSVDAQPVSTDSGRTQSVPDQTQSSMSQPSPSSLVHQTHVSRVHAHHHQASKTASNKPLGPQHVRALDQNSPLLSKSKSATQPSSTKPHRSQSVSRDARRTRSVLDQAQARTFRSPHSVKHTQVSSADALPPQTSNSVSVKSLVSHHIGKKPKEPFTKVKLSHRVWKFHGYRPRVAHRQPGQVADSDAHALEPCSANLPGAYNASGLNSSQPSTVQGSTHEEKDQRQPSQEGSAQPQLTKEALNIHRNWLSGLPTSLQDVLGVGDSSAEELQDPPPKDSEKTEIPPEILESPSADLPGAEKDSDLSDAQHSTLQGSTCEEQGPKQLPQEGATEPQATKEALHEERNWLSAIPSSIRELMDLPPVKKQVSDTASATSVKAGTTMEIVHNTLADETLRCQVNLVRLDITLPPAGHPLPRYRVHEDGSLDVIPLQGFKKKDLLTDSESSGSPLSLDPSDGDYTCDVCHTHGGTLMCVTCGRGLHRRCHLPPITVQINPARWQCSLCQDLSDSTDPYRKDRHRKPCLSPMDQRRCEHLVFALMCKNSSILFNSNLDSATSVNFDLIHGRLLRKRSPPYRTPSELVSDVWVLLDYLLSSSEETSEVMKMQKSFEKRVKQVFGTTLHPSLLTRPAENRTKELDHTGGEIKRETSKRKKDSAEDCTEPIAKKNSPGLD